MLDYFPARMKNIVESGPGDAAVQRTSGAGAQMKRRRAIGEAGFGPAEVALRGGAGDPQARQPDAAMTSELTRDAPEEHLERALLTKRESYFLQAFETHSCTGYSWWTARSNLRSS
jgi:hypothetical protein